jgi:3-oxoacyl-[acyl-carrier-protein] synthase-1
VIGALALREQWLPAGINTTEADPALGLNYQLTGGPARLRAVLSNSFGFGGTNCSLLFARADGALHGGAS